MTTWDPARTAQFFDEAGERRRVPEADAHGGDVVDLSPFGAGSFDAGVLPHVRADEPEIEDMLAELNAVGARRTP